MLEAPEPRRSKTILVTFAGRRDRMALLTRYVDRAIEQGLIDEWHVWDFSRNEADRQWLRQQFPFTQSTPSNSLEYFAHPERLAIEGDKHAIRFSVSAARDAHIGLRPLGHEGPSYEFVLGGWNNQVTAVRLFEKPSQLVDIGSRDPAHRPIAGSLTPGLMPEFGFVTVELDLGGEDVRVIVQGQAVLHAKVAIAPGSYELLYRTGFGVNGEWLFQGAVEAKARLFARGPTADYPPGSMFYTNAYQYYGANRDRYNGDIFLKCDDDIVFLDLTQLGEFLNFRRRNPQFFLVSANVVNNGVCAHFQQAGGAIPDSFDQFEMPPGGMCGSLWASGTKAQRLHELFLSNPSAFRQTGLDPIVWRERLSINFVSWLGADLIHIPDIMNDDEHDLCYGVRKRARKVNCLYPGFVASHLSFWKQDAEMDISALLARYRDLAARELDALPDDAASAAPYATSFLPTE